MVWHKCEPPPGPRRRVTIDELFPDEGSLFDQRSAIFQQMLEDYGG